MAIAEFSEGTNAEKIYELLKSGKYQRVWFELVLDPYCVSDNYPDDKDFQDVVSIECAGISCEAERTLRKTITKDLDFDESFKPFSKINWYNLYGRTIEKWCYDELNDELKKDAISFEKIYDAMEDYIDDSNCYYTINVQEPYHGEIYSECINPKSW